MTTQHLEESAETADTQLWTAVRRGLPPPDDASRSVEGADNAITSPPGVVIVDTSYVIFAKYYSTLSWYKTFLDSTPDITQVMNSSVFKSKYALAFTTGIARICRAHGVPLHRVLFAKDCSKENVWRRKIMPNYKGSRTHNKSFNRQVFQYTYTKVIPEWIEGHQGVTIGVNAAEADDVIGVAHRIFSACPQDCGPIVIISNDNDCIQLSDGNTSIVNLVMTDVAKRRGTLTPKQYLESRILSGDRSDNISGILPRCGMKTAIRIVTSGGIDIYSPEQIKAWNRNDILMNLNNTPEDLQTAIRDTIVTSFGLKIDLPRSNQI
jgi:5'-3' exonuclease